MGFTNIHPNPYSYDSRKCINIIFLIILIVSDYGKHAMHKLRPDSVQDRHFVFSFGHFPFIILVQFPPCTLWQRPGLPCAGGF
ncbi:hypothetical protein Barb4_03098 [Bacteroidales bacterium Barb4]|nr:hypothetical protein Barb4_03098 [Bacteroidales bacterium Barb4]